MSPEERKSLPLEDARRVRTEREPSQFEAVARDVGSSPLRGKPLPLRLRNFRPEADAYLASAGGPLPYMQRLREIERLTAEHEATLRDEHERLAVASSEADFAEAWRLVAESRRFDEVNDLIDRHNRWFPVEARLPMDPRRGDFALVNGRDYRRRPLDAEWLLERFPAVRPDPRLRQYAGARRRV